MILLPKPKECRFLQSRCVIKSGLLLAISGDKDLTKEALVKFKRDFPSLLGIAGKTPLTLREEQKLTDDAYELIVLEEGITLSYGTARGCFYGFTTLKQLLLQQEKHAIGCVIIKDAPDFPHRGLMLDISRNRVYNRETMFRLIDMLADLKINQLQFNVEGNSYAYPSKEKYYNTLEDMLTKDDVLAIDTYCQRNLIDFIPNQNSFGHMSYWLNQDEFKHLAECPDGFTYRWMVNSPSTTLNPSLDESFTFVKGLFNELLEGYSSNTVNIGADEPFELGLGKNKDLVEENGRAHVYATFIKKIYDDLKGKGYNVMMWGDVIKNHPKILNLLPNDIIALEWGYDEFSFSDEDLQKYVKAGFNYYVCAGTSMWNSIAGIHQNMVLNIKRAAKLGKRNHALGFLNTDWGDGGSWQQLSLSYFPYVFGAAHAWNAEAEQEQTTINYLDAFIYKDTTGRLANFLKQIGYYSAIEKEKPDNATKLFKLLYIQQTDHVNFGVNYSDPMFVTKDEKRLSFEEYSAYEVFFTNKLKAYKTMNIGSEDAKIIDHEISFSLKILLAGAILGKLLVNIHDQRIEDVLRIDRLLNESIEHFDYAWAYRNKRSDKHLSQQRMFDLKYKIEAWLKSSKEV